MPLPLAATAATPAILCSGAPVPKTCGPCSDRPFLPIYTGPGATRLSRFTEAYAAHGRGEKAPSSDALDFSGLRMERWGGLMLPEQTALAVLTVPRGPGGRERVVWAPMGLPTVVDAAAALGLGVLKRSFASKEEMMELDTRGDACIDTATDVVIAVDLDLLPFALHWMTFFQRTRRDRKLPEVALLLITRLDLFCGHSERTHFASRLKLQTLWSPTAPLLAYTGKGGATANVVCMHTGVVGEVVPIWNATTDFDTTVHVFMEAKEQTDREGVENKCGGPLNATFVNPALLLEGGEVRYARLKPDSLVRAHERVAMHPGGELHEQSRRLVVKSALRQLENQWENMEDEAPGPAASASAGFNAPAPARGDGVCILFALARAHIVLTRVGMPPGVWHMPGVSPICGAGGPECDSTTNAVLAMNAEMGGMGEVVFTLGDGDAEGLPPDWMCSEVSALPEGRVNVVVVSLGQSGRTKYGVLSAVLHECHLASRRIGAPVVVVAVTVPSVFEGPCGAVPYTGFSARRQDGAVDMPVCTIVHRTPPTTKERRSQVVLVYVCDNKTAYELHAVSGPPVFLITETPVMTRRPDAEDCRAMLRAMLRRTSGGAPDTRGLARSDVVAVMGEDAVARRVSAGAFDRAFEKCVAGWGSKARNKPPGAAAGGKAQPLGKRKRKVRRRRPAQE